MRKEEGGAEISKSVIAGGKGGYGLKSLFRQKDEIGGKQVKIDFLAGSKRQQSVLVKREQWEGVTRRKKGGTIIWS